MASNSKSPARVLLVSANREEINMASWPLGMACTAAATRLAGHDVRTLDLMLFHDPHSALDRVIREFRPEIVGVSIRNIDDQCMRDKRWFLDDVKDLIAHCRARSNAPIVLGGAGYSIYP
ncbi:MAG: cobalamin-dependent protein, partial [Pseudomonadota bacterium]